MMSCCELIPVLICQRSVQTLNIIYYITKKHHLMVFIISFRIVEGEGSLSYPRKSGSNLLPIWSVEESDNEIISWFIHIVISVCDLSLV